MNLCLEVLAATFRVSRERGAGSRRKRSKRSAKLFDDLLIAKSL
jgi:hypothetical protein